MLRVGYLGPAGTYAHEVLTAKRDAGTTDAVPLPTVHDTIMAVHDGTVDRGVVPMENSLEGSVNATLDALAVETTDVVIVGETVLPVRHSLIAAGPLELTAVEAVISHPQATAQCAEFLRAELPGARILAANSTADAVRQVADDGRPWAAIGSRLSAELYGGEVLREGVEDRPGNVTRFVWLARRGAAAGEGAAWKTSLVFWGAGDDAPGWLVRCLSEFAFRGVNLAKIESRPRKEQLGHYMFFADLEGRDTDAEVAEAVEGLRAQAEEVRVLGSYPSA